MCKERPRPAGGRSGWIASEHARVRARFARWRSCKRNSPCEAAAFLSRSGRMTRRNRWLIPYLAAVVAFILRLWMNTMRVRTVSADGRSHPDDPRHARYIYAFWHEGLLAPLATRPKIRVLNSQHHDGEF